MELYSSRLGSSSSAETSALVTCNMRVLVASALVCGFAFVLGFVLLLGPLSLYVENSLDAEFSVGFLQQHFAWLYVWNAVIYVVFGIALVFFSVALYLQIRCQRSMLALLMLCFGCIWAAHAISAGMLANVGLQRVLELFDIDRSIAESVWLSTYTIKLGLGGSNEIIGGLWMIMASLVAGRSELINAKLRGYGVLIGACGCATVVPMWQEMGSVFGLGMIIWFFWMPAVVKAHVTR